MASIASAAPAAPSASSSPADENRPQSRRSALLAALPSLLIGLLLFLPDALRAWGVIGIPAQSTGPASLPYILFVTVIFVGVFVAWRRSWPAWGGAYYFIAWLIPLLYLSYRFGSQSALLLYPPLLAVLCYRLAVVDRLKFLLAILPVLVFTWPVWNEFIPVKFENLEFTLVFCLAALTAYWILRRGDWRLGMWLLLGLITIVGVTATIVYNLSADYPGHIPQITPSNILENMAPLWLAGAAMLLCPLLLASLHTLARRSGGAGRLGFWLIFAALLAWMTASFSVFFQGSGNEISVQCANFSEYLPGSQPGLRLALPGRGNPADLFRPETAGACRKRGKPYC